MSYDKIENTELFICTCGDPEHQLIMRYWSDDEDPEVYVSVYLSNNDNFFKRLWNGLKYAFGHKSIYGDFTEFIFKKSDANRLQKVVDFLKKDKKE